MKRKWLRTVSIASLSGVILASLLVSASTAFASAELDRQYALNTVGFLKSWDNADGLFADYVEQAYKDFFAKQSRFVLQDLSKGSAVLEKSKLSYAKVIEDKEVLGQLARSMKSESVIRTKIIKEGPTYRFQLDWLHAPRMDLIATEKFTLEESKGSSGIGDLKTLLQTALANLIEKLPFRGQVTGRDQSTITVNLGLSSKIQKGDQLVIGTLDEVKKHPLLQQIVDWRTSRTGRAEIEEVEDGISFAKILEQEPGREIGRFQKILEIVPAPKPKIDPSAVQVDNGDEERAARAREMPRLGWGAGGLWVGAYTRQFSTSGGATGVKGSGFLFGGKADGQLWLNRDWFAEVNLGYGFAGYSQSDIVSGADTGLSMSVSAFQLKLAGGYTYYATGELFGPRGWAKLGFMSTSYSMAASNTDLTGPGSYSGLFIGVGADLPLRQGYGALLTLDFGFLTGASQTGIDNIGDPSGATAVQGFVGGYYRASNRMTYRIGVDVLANGADFANGSTVTQRVISLGPSLVFYF